MAWPESSFVRDDGRPSVIGHLEIRSETAAECGTVLRRHIAKSHLIFVRLS